MKRVAVAMSGGIDSAVSALLLKRQGYSVEGVYMFNWDEKNEKGVCPSEEDYAHVIDVCQKIGIRYSRAEFVKEYWTDVFSDFIQGIERGVTPNPDVVCNQRIKFGVLQKHVFKKMGVSFLATGHYARVNRLSDGSVQLLRAIDSFKDQTYFLSTVSQDSLKRTLFPIGNLTKTEVRQLAKEAGFHKIAEKKESMGICFIGKRRFQMFLQEYIEDRPGLFLSHDGHVMGEHKGHHYYTIGQRTGFICMNKPWFVAHKDPLKNTVTIVDSSNHPLLFCDTFTTDHAHWIRETLMTGKEREFDAKYRHQQQKLFRCTVSALDNGLLVKSHTHLRGVSPGQYVVFYNGDECVGGASVSRIVHNNWKDPNTL